MINRTSLINERNDLSLKIFDSEPNAPVLIVISTHRDQQYLEELKELMNLKKLNVVVLNSHPKALRQSIIESTLKSVLLHFPNSIINILNCPRYINQSDLDKRSQRMSLLAKHDGYQHLWKGFSLYRLPDVWSFISTLFGRFNPFLEASENPPSWLEGRLENTDLNRIKVINTNRWLFMGSVIQFQYYFKSTIWESLANQLADKTVRITFS